MEDIKDIKELKKRVARHEVGERSEKKEYT